jgi:hypothetical protein
MNNAASNDCLELQRDVQRMLGRCMLRLQQYERLIKAIVANSEISASGPPFESNLEDRAANAANKTLGTLIGQLLGTVVTDGEQKDTPEADAPDDILSFKMKMSLQMSVEDFDRTQNDLKELVELRNNLVHHFIDQHDLWNLDGCHTAKESLAMAYNRIDQHFEKLRGWAESMDRSKRIAADVFKSDAFNDLLFNGILPDGSVDWSAAGAIRALREATDELAIDGWTPIAAAGKWVAQRHPDQLPEKYGCSSWRQVIHESHLFELRYREMNGQRAAWYRPKVKTPKTTH